MPARLLRATLLACLVAAVSIVVAASGDASFDAFASGAVPDASADLEHSFALLREAFTPHGAYVHPALTLAHSEECGSSGLFVGEGKKLSAGEHLLELPNSLALTPERAYESVAPLLTTEQRDAIAELQQQTCGLVDWNTALYVAISAYQWEHPVLAHLDSPLLTAEEINAQTEDQESGFVTGLPTCPSYFFPVFAEQSFSPRLHSAWATMIGLYPPTCTSLVCQPVDMLIDILNTPLMLEAHQQHIGCFVAMHSAIDQVLELLQSAVALPPISLELMVWSVSMVLSRQQTVAVAVDNMDQRVVALMPFLDLHNSAARVNNTHASVYATKFVESARLNSASQPQPGVLTVTQGAFEAGSEVFDLYGGEHPSTNVDLLSFFGFATSELPTDHLSLVVALCTDVNERSDANHTKLMESTLDRMEIEFDSAPLAVDELWEEEEHMRFEFVGTKQLVEHNCENNRLFQSTLATSGVSITLPILARLAVATSEQLADDQTVQRLIGGGMLTQDQDIASLNMVLHWLRSAEEASSAEWMELRCEQHPHEFLPYPEIPELSEAEQAMVRLEIDVLWRQADPSALAFLYQSLDAIEDANGQTNFLFHPSFHVHLCTLKTNHRRLIVEAAISLAKLLQGP